MKTMALAEIVLLLCTVALLLVSPAPVSASNVGVSPGMWWKYGQLSSSGPPYSNVSWVKNTIQSVNGFTVTMQETYHYNNGTENNQELSGNIQTGDGDLQEFIILGGLQKNDPVYQGGSSGWINDTITGTYANVNKNVNYQNITYSDLGYNQTTLSYWDQSTGILLEVHFDYSPYIGTGLQYSLKVTQASQSILAPVFSGTPLILGVVAIISSVCFAVKRRLVSSNNNSGSTRPHKPHCYSYLG